MTVPRPHPRRRRTRRCARLCREQLRGRAAHAAPGAGDERDLPVEPAGHRAAPVVSIMPSCPIVVVAFMTCSRVRRWRCRRSARPAVAGVACVGARALFERPVVHLVGDRVDAGRRGLHEARREALGERSRTKLWRGVTSCCQSFSQSVSVTAGVAWLGCSRRSCVIIAARILSSAATRAELCAAVDFAVSCGRAESRCCAVDGTRRDRGRRGVVEALRRATTRRHRVGERPRPRADEHDARADDDPLAQRGSRTCSGVLTAPFVCGGSSVDTPAYSLSAGGDCQPGRVGQGAWVTWVTPPGRPS